MRTKAKSCKVTEKILQTNCNLLKIQQRFVTTGKTSVQIFNRIITDRVGQMTSLDCEALFVFARSEQKVKPVCAHLSLGHTKRKIRHKLSVMLEADDASSSRRNQQGWCKHCVSYPAALPRVQPTRNDERRNNRGYQKNPVCIVWQPWYTQYDEQHLNNKKLANDKHAWDHGVHLSTNT